MPDQDVDSIDCTNNNLPDFLTPKEIKYINQYREFVKTHEIKKPDTQFVQNLKKRFDAVTKEQIERARKEILDYIEQNRSKLKITEKFIRELTLDNYLRAYIARHESNKVVEKVVHAMEFLSTTDGIDDDNFPVEFLEFGVNIATGFDVYGNPVFYLLAKRNFIPRKLFNISQKYMAYLIFQLVRIALFTNNFFTMCLDFSGAGMGNVDFHALRLLIKILNEYAPHTLNRIIIYNIHWIIRPAFSAAQSFLPSYVADMMIPSNGREISKFIGDDQLFNHIEGGLNDEIVLGRPKKDGISFLDISHQLNVTKDEAAKLIEQFRKILKKNNCELLTSE